MLEAISWRRGAAWCGGGARGHGDARGMDCEGLFAAPFVAAKLTSCGALSAWPLSIAETASRQRARPLPPPSDPGVRGIAQAPVTLRWAGRSVQCGWHLKPLVSAEAVMLP